MGSVDENGPLFSGPVAKNGARDGSRRHDEYIYGED